MTELSKAQLSIIDKYNLVFRDEKELFQDSSYDNMTIRLVIDDLYMFEAFSWKNFIALEKLILKANNKKEKKKEETKPLKIRPECFECYCSAVCKAELQTDLERECSSFLHYSFDNEKSDSSTPQELRDTKILMLLKDVLTEMVNKREI